jgi:hypothetical protein
MTVQEYALHFSSEKGECMQTETVLRAAETVLEKKNKFDSAIQTGVSELQSLIVARLETERTFRRLEAAAAIGEPAPDLAKLKKAAADARVALDQASLKLSGLRSAVGELGCPLVESYTLLSTELPKHFAAITSSFSEEWHCALTAWNLALGRRRALEALLDQELDLDEAAPAPVTLSADTTRPSETLLSLEKAIKHIAGGKALAERPVAPGYDAQGVYRVTSDRMAHQGILRGAFAVDATFRPGELARLVAFSEARAVLDRDVLPGVVAAATKATEIEKTAREKELVDSERRLHGGPELSSTRRLDLEELYNHKPPKADPTKVDADIAAGIAGSAQERERQHIIDASLREAADKDEARAAKQAAGRAKVHQAEPPKQWPEALH